MIATTLFGLMLMHTGAASIQSCLFLPNVMLHGGTVDEFQTNDITQCCVQCSTSSCCIAYTYDTVKRRCYLKNAIGYSSEDSSKTSGLKPNSRFGKGVTLRNVRILGDQANRIDLRSEEECRQYCTAYQVFSWAPPTREEDVLTSGQCACTMRIKTLSYEYGCVSEINPPQV